MKVKNVKRGTRVVLKSDVNEFDVHISKGTVGILLEDNDHKPYVCWLLDSFNDGHDYGDKVEESTGENHWAVEVDKLRLEKKGV